MVPAAPLRVVMLGAAADEQAAGQLRRAAEVDGRRGRDVPQQVGGQVGEVRVGERVDGLAARAEQALDVEVDGGSGQVDDDRGTVGHAEHLERSGPDLASVAPRLAPSTEKTCGSEAPSPVSVIAASVTSTMPVTGRSAYAAGLGWQVRQQRVVRRGGAGHLRHRGSLRGRRWSRQRPRPPTTTSRAQATLRPRAASPGRRSGRRRRRACRCRRAASTCEPVASDADLVGARVGTDERGVPAGHHGPLGTSGAAGDVEVAADQDRDVSVEPVAGADPIRSAGQVTGSRQRRRDVVRRALPAVLPPAPPRTPRALQGGMHRRPPRRCDDSRSPRA